MRNYIDPVVIIGLLISIFLGILGAIVIPNNAQFGIIITLFCAVITLLIDISAKLSQNINFHKESDQKLLQVIKDQISARLHNSEIFNEIIDDFFRQFHVNLHNLAQGFIDIGDGYLSVNDLFSCGSGAIERSQTKVLAVEAGSNYNKWATKPSFQNYHNVTVKAIKTKKVNFTRIWIINQDISNYYNIWRRHRRDGIQTYYVHENDLPDWLKNPDYLDFAIIDEQILLRSRINVHPENGKIYEGGTISIVHAHLEMARKRFQALKHQSREFTG